MKPQPDSDSRLSSSLRSKLERMAADYAGIEASLSQDAVANDFRRARELSLRRAALEPAIRMYAELLNAEQEIVELRQIASRRTSGDQDEAELAQLATKELREVERRQAETLSRLVEALVTSDDPAVGAVILEIRAGVGGDEAALWAGDLLRMYEQFSNRRAWRIETLELSEGATGGVKSASLSITGEGAWESLSHEAGTHCVKRVPATETQGRIHTSTATVAVLPEPEEVDLKIDPADVVEHVTTAQGPGGQNVNKVATAVHLVHTPTGVEVRMQESKSQRQNREKAWRLLRARLYEIELEKARTERNAARASQIGGAERSERIRTYRFKENIVVDHRLERQFNLGDLLAGGLDSVCEAMRRAEIERRITEL